MRACRHHGFTTTSRQSVGERARLRSSCAALRYIFRIRSLGQPSEVPLSRLSGTGRSRNVWAPVKTDWRAPIFSAWSKRRVPGPFPKERLGRFPAPFEIPPGTSWLFRGQPWHSPGSPRPRTSLSGPGLPALAGSNGEWSTGLGPAVRSGVNATSGNGRVVDLEGHHPD